MSGEIFIVKRIQSYNQFLLRLFRGTGAKCDTMLLSYECSAAFDMR